MTRLWPYTGIEIVHAVETHYYINEIIMKRQLELLSHIFLWAITIIGIFKIGEGAFWLMSSRSTIYNIGGLIICVLLISGISLFTINKIKK